MDEYRNENTSTQKSYRFAIRIIGLYKHLTEEKREYVLSKQILRSGISIGANLAEADFAISRKDFLSKLYIALKESSETRYWLMLLHEGSYITDEMFRSMYSDCEELIKILAAATKTLKQG